MSKTDIVTGVPRTQLDNAVILAFIVIVVVCKNVEGTTCNHLQTKEFVPALNKELRLVSYWKKITRSPVICVSYCHSDPNCQSVNYHTSSHLCQLNNVTRVQYHEDFITQYDSLYFDARANTSLLSAPDPTPSTDTYTSRLYFDSDVTTQLFSQPDKPFPSVPPQTTSCEQLLATGNNVSDINTIFPSGFSNGLAVYCDMEIDGGGWIVIQRRQDGSVDFNRNFDEYRYGFGDLSGEFWLGNENLHNLTESNGPWQLRVDLENIDGETAASVYSGFQLNSHYTFSLGSFQEENSSAGDALMRSSFTAFSTRDVVNYLREGCLPTGGWWFLNCPESTINSPYDDMQWNTWRNKNDNPYPLKSCSMKIRITA